MAVYIDNARIPYGRMKMSHMIADTPDELHKMAAALGLCREWFQNGRFPHYDISLSKKATAIRMGATEVTSKELIRILKDA